MLDHKMTDKREEIESLQEKLREGTTPEDVAAAHCLEYDDAHDLIVLPGYWADDGNCAVHYPDAEDGTDAADDYASGGDWGDSDTTRWVTVMTWRDALDADGDRVRTEESTITVELPPDEPACVDAQGHDWREPHELVGGIEENPGVWGHGGGVLMRSACVRCGCGRTVDTWAQDPTTGEQGLTSTTYTPGEYAEQDDDRGDPSDYDVCR